MKTLEPAIVCRILAQSKYARKLGIDARMLLIVITYSNDRRFRNIELQERCGFGSLKRLIAARQTAINAGWLVYTAGDKTKSGRYEITLPSHIQIIEIVRKNRENEACRSDTEPHLLDFI